MAWSFQQTAQTIGSIKRKHLINPWCNSPHPWMKYQWQLIEPSLSCRRTQASRRRVTNMILHYRSKHMLHKGEQHANYNKRSEDCTKTNVFMCVCVCLFVYRTLYQLETCRSLSLYQNSKSPRYFKKFRFINQKSHMEPEVCSVVCWDQFKPLLLITSYV